ncbi:hypothetical protein SNL152K_10652 [Streptomyces sp. NL15-2K]|nr:hypothetical protein SNL152K_10652 [Streptomyces sp. NL15-2K]
MNVSFQAGGIDEAESGSPSPTHVVVRVYENEGQAENSAVVHIIGRREVDVLDAAARWMAENDSETFIQDISFHQHGDIALDQHDYELRIYVTLI